MIERFNTETKTDPRLRRVIDFAVMGVKFSPALLVPVYIWEKLTDEDWHYAEERIREFAEDLVRQQVLAGGFFVPGAQECIRVHVQEYANKAVYNQFMKYQVRAGHQEGHEVPECLA